MPIIKSAKKKMKQDKKRQSRNKFVIKTMKEKIKNAKREKNKKATSSAYSAIDTASKKKIIHKNKAARLKSKLVKNILSKKSKPKTQKSKRSSSLK